jgi:hypothetical protein
MQLLVVPNLTRVYWIMEDFAGIGFKFLELGIFL